MKVQFADEDLPQVDDFGAWMREARLAAGVSLEQMAATTKVGRSLLLALERNDVSRWPAGIFRRAFVRSYARMVGLNEDLAVAAFLRAFPEGPEPDHPLALSVHAAKPVERRRHRREEGLRLTLAPEALRWQAAAARLGAAVTDMMAPITVALPSGLLGGQALFWIVLAVVAVLYVTVGTLLLGTTPGLWMMQKVGSQPLGARRMAWRREVSETMLFGESTDEAAEREVSPVHR